MSNSKRRALLTRARDYPYAYPRHAYVFRDGEAQRFDGASIDGRTPVLAIGSNQSPSRLSQKFGRHHEIPVQRAWLDDFDVVYSAHVARYGAVPAMLQVSPGSSVSIGVTWLDPAQLEIMHASELSAANYRYATLEGVRVVLDDGRQLASVSAYVGRHAHLAGPCGAAVSLAAIDCRARRYPAITTAEALELARARGAPHLDADTFVLRLITDELFRRKVVARLARDAVPFVYSRGG